MPELPEVETTVRGLRKILPGHKIIDIWSDYPLPAHRAKNHIKSAVHYESFKKAVIGTRVRDVTRRGKNILVELINGYTILMHMKMTGHFLHGTYQQTRGVWTPKEKTGALVDPFNRFIRLVFTLDTKKHLAFSDLRKFGKVALIETKDIPEHPDLVHLGPEPLLSTFTYKKFLERLSKKPNGKIKQVLMDQSVLVGVGNIYSDEVLFVAGIHPLSRTAAIPQANLRKLFAAIQKILRYSISLGGDSASDYRNLDGKRGGFQDKHRAYHKTGTKCSKPGCKGKIERLKLGGRSAHFCATHQKRFA